MKKTLLTIFVTSFAWSAIAQLSPGTLATDVNPFLCQPGVVNKSPGKGASISYTFNPDYKMRPPDAESDSKIRRNERFSTNLKIPLINGDKFKALIGLQYSVERYHFTKIVPENYPLFKKLNESDLKSAGVAAYFVVPINHRFYTSFRLSAGWNGDYSNFLSLDNRYATYRAAGLLGVKKGNSLEYGIGLVFTKGFRNNGLVPFGFYNQTFNKRWGIEAALPTSIKGRYNINPRMLTMFGVEYSSRSYALAVKEPSMNPFIPTEKAPFNYHRSGIDLVSSFYRQLSGWTWLEFKGGYSFNMNSEARDLPAQQSYNLSPSGSWVGMVSFFISPPRH